METAVHPSTQPTSASSLPSIAVAVCTYQRNDALRTLLNALVDVAQHTRDLARIGIVVVDDNPDRAAEPIVSLYADLFDLGIHYRHSGAKNISLARNLAIETAAPLADWVAMTDDDCEPEADWLRCYLAVLDRTGADCATGEMHFRAPAGAPRWLTDQPFFDDVRLDLDDGHAMAVAATNNSIIRSAFLLDHRELRFAPELGVVGGEDMVFYRTAVTHGLRICFSRDASVWGNEPLRKATLLQQIRYRYWLGNTEAVTNLYLRQATRFRLFCRGLRRLVVAIFRPVRRVATGNSPQLRYAMASICGALGLVVGSAGVQLPHPTEKS
ncbi:MAG: glycosyltransferase family 2 protein [Actinomycetota bacterium]|nr:glycosyltransferase family 2 protein [Actinomycetota bacterium]